MSSKIKVSDIRNYIREIIKQELEEASVTGNIDGGEGPPKTPFAFSGKRKKDKLQESFDLKEKYLGKEFASYFMADNVILKFDFSILIV